MLLYLLIIVFLASCSLLNLVLIIFFSILSIFRKERLTEDYKKNVTIIIPAYNEEKNIIHCLNAIFQSHYSLHKIHVICVNDKSSDQTLKILQQYSIRRGSLKILQGTHTGKANALNLGIKHAKDEIILTLDADVILDSNYIRNIMQPFQNTEVGCVVGISMIQPTNSIVGNFQRIEFAYLNYIRMIMTRVFKQPLWIIGCAICFRKSELEHIGGFQNGTLNEDFNIALRLFPNCKTTIATQAIAYTSAHNGLRDLFRQRMRWHFGSIQNLFHYRSHIKLSYPSIVYLYFSALLWISNCIIILPFFLLTSLSLFLKSPVALIQFWARVGSLFGIGEVIFYISTKHEFIFSITTLYLVITLTFILFQLISIFTFEKNYSLRFLISYFIFFTYNLFLQLNFLSSLFKYSFSKNPSFIKER
jgi:cellulose synthase/poly-beta-1,6-N-acetylglucosamine synthase-like glycosyltransferase